MNDLNSYSCSHKYEARTSSRLALFIDFGREKPYMTPMVDAKK